MVKKRGRTWQGVALLVVSTGLTLGVLEAATRRLLPPDPYEIVPDEAGAEPIGLRHPTRGHSLRPNFRGHFVHPEFAGEKVAINGSGFRDREVRPRGRNDSQDVDGLNVTVLGDSVTFGMGVEASETFSALLESKLTDQLERPVRVFNAGVSGYGALHELVVLREEYPRQQPNIAVVAFYTGNDLQDVYGFYREHGAVVDLLSHFAAATTKSTRKVGKNVLKINGESRKVLSAHPEAEIRFPLRPEWIRSDARLRFGVALKPDSWGKPKADGVRFEILAEDDVALVPLRDGVTSAPLRDGVTSAPLRDGVTSAPLRGDGRAVTLFDEVIDPNQDVALRGWNDREVDLSEVAATGTLVFRTTGGPGGSLDYDWAVWAVPHIFYQDAGDVLEGERLPSRLLLKPAFKQYWKRIVPGKASMSSRVYWEKRSSLFKLVAGRFDILAVRWGLKPPKAIFSYYMISSFEREMSQYVRTGLDMTLRAVAEMQAFMSARGGRVILLLIPAKFQTEPDTVRRFTLRAGIDPRQIDIDQPHRILLDACRRSGVTCVDLLPELRRTVASGERVYFQEGHPNRLGHRIIAQHLAAAIEGLAHGAVNDHIEVSPLSKPSAKITVAEVTW